MTLRGSASSRRETSPRTSDGQLGDWTDWFYFVALDVRDQVISGQMGWVNIVLYSQNEIFLDCRHGDIDREITNENRFQ